MPKHETYCLEVGSAGYERLAILNEICNPYTFSFLDKNINLEGKRVLDVGCGVGFITKELAQRVGANGSVTAIDISEEQIAIAKTICKDYPVDFQQLAVADLKKLSGPFDFIFCRFLLIHLHNIETIIEDMVALLTPNGRIMFEESVNYDAMFCYPHSDTFEKWKAAVLKQHELFSTDFTCGKKLPCLLANLNVAQQDMNLVQPLLFTKRQKDMLTEGAKEVTPLYIKKQLMTQEISKELIKSLETFANDDRYTVGFCSYMQVIGKKR